MLVELKMFPEPYRDTPHYLITVPFPGSYGAPVVGYTLGRPTTGVVCADPDWGWTLWLMDDQGKFWQQTTHVKNQLLDDSPWVLDMLKNLGIL